MKYILKWKSKGKKKIHLFKQNNEKMGFYYQKFS